MPNSLFALLALAFFAFPPQQTDSSGRHAGLEGNSARRGAYGEPHHTHAGIPGRKQKAGTPSIAPCAMERTATAKAILGSFPI